MANTPKDTPQEPTVLGAEGAEELIAKLDAGFPPAWIPTTKGDTIVGAFLRLETGMTPNGPAPVAVIGTAEGERSVFLFYEALKSGFRRSQPEPGEKIAVRYEGKKEAKTPTQGRNAEYHDFSVSVDRGAEKAVDWNAALGGESPRAGSSEPSPAEAAGGE